MMKQIRRPLISVVIPTYNRGHLLPKAISSVLDQTYRDLELIVVDDRSTDDTRQVVERIEDQRIIYIRNEGSRGATGARNAGIRNARGEYIGFLDSDDEWHLNKLSLQVQLLQCCEPTAIIGCGWEWSDQISRRTRVRRIPDEWGRVNGLPRWYFNIIPDILIPRKIVEKNLFDETLGTYEVIDWLICLFRNGHSFQLVPEVLVTCYDHRGARNSDGGLKRIQVLASIAEKHREFLCRDQLGWATLTQKVGAGLLVADGETAYAKKFLGWSIKARPGSLRSWMYFLGTCIPGGRKAIKTIVDLRKG